MLDMDGGQFPGLINKLVRGTWSVTWVPLVSTAGVGRLTSTRVDTEA